MTNRNTTLTDEEKLILINAGWKFLKEDHIFIPDDYDSCIAYGIETIRYILEKINNKNKTNSETLRQ